MNEAPLSSTIELPTPAEQQGYHRVAEYLARKAFSGALDYYRAGVETPRYYLPAFGEHPAGADGLDVSISVFLQTARNETVPLRSALRKLTPRAVVRTFAFGAGVADTEAPDDAAWRAFLTDLPEALGQRRLFEPGCEGEMRQVLLAHVPSAADWLMHLSTPPELEADPERQLRVAGPESNVITERVHQALTLVNQMAADFQGEPAPSVSPTPAPTYWREVAQLTSWIGARSTNAILDRNVARVPFAHQEIGRVVAACGREIAQKWYFAPLGDEAAGPHKSHEAHTVHTILTSSSFTAFRQQLIVDEATHVINDGTRQAFIDRAKHAVTSSARHAIEVAPSVAGAVARLWPGSISGPTSARVRLK